MVAGEVRRGTLPNGLRVVTEQVPGSRTFSVGFFVPVGSRHESARLDGASHFLEHVLFKGTRRRTAEEISIAVESVGGDLNAYTAKEHTCFYARVVDADAELAIDVLADMITVLVDHHRRRGLRARGDLGRDRHARRRSGRGGARDDHRPRSSVIRVWGLPVIGSQASIRAMTRAQVAGTGGGTTGRTTMVVAATGHVDHDRLLDQLGALDAGRGADSGPAAESRR